MALVLSAVIAAGVIGTFAIGVDWYSNERKGVQTPPPASVQSAGTSGVTWTKIPGGRFQMGSNVYDDEKPVHQVTVPSFEMLRTEVTVAQYAACVKEVGCEKPRDKNDNKYCNWGYADRGKHPINCVDWNQARAFCAWAGGRLPSEAEWEYAARSGGKNQKYPWGDETASCVYAVMKARSRGCGEDRTWPVCSPKRGNTDQGLCDMSGNVAEWVEDRWHGDYKGAPDDGSAWVSDSDNQRMLRGGSWRFGNPRWLRAGFRPTSNPVHWFDDVGFRCSRDGN